MTFFIFVMIWLSGFCVGYLFNAKAKEKLQMARDALEYFVIRVDEGSIRSVKTCRFFKEVLEKTK